MDEQFAFRIWRLVATGWVFLIFLVFVTYVLAPSLEHAFGV